MTTFGSEKIREAACHLIACLAEAGVVVGEEDSKGLKEVIASSLKRKEESVQQFAVSAFGTMARYDGFDSDTVNDCIQQVISSRHLYGRRGYALALGAIPFNLPLNYTYLPDVLSALCSTMTIKVIDGSILAILPHKDRPTYAYHCLHCLSKTTGFSSGERRRSKTQCHHINTKHHQTIR